jgi:mono/diheme cytochrome c family protein
MSGARLLAAATLTLAIAAARASAAPPAAPPALYAAGQAAAGEGAYTASCAVCHGTRLEGGAGPPLAGEAYATRTAQEHARVGDVFATVARLMPLNAPASLGPDRSVEIMAYLLQRNGYPAGQTPLTYDGALRSAAAMTSYGGTAP